MNIYLSQLKKPEVFIPSVRFMQMFVNPPSHFFFHPFRRERDTREGGGIREEGAVGSARGRGRKYWLMMGMSK